MCEQIGHLSRNIETLKQNQMEIQDLKTTISEILKK